jgi:hypothetical protein
MRSLTLRKAAWSATRFESIRRNGVTEYELRGTPGRTGFVVVHEVRARRADTAAISPLRPLHPRLEVEHELQQGSASKAGTPACAALLSR